MSVKANLIKRGYWIWSWSVGTILCVALMFVPTTVLARDFRIQRRQTIINGFTATDSTFTPVTGLTRAFVRNVSTEGGGTGSGTAGTLNANRVTPTTELTAVNTVSLTRTTNQNACRVFWEIWEYLGPMGGQNEFVVRTQSTITLNNGQGAQNLDISAAGVVNASRCVVFLTGVRHNSNSRAEYRSHCCHIYLLDANTLRVERLSTSGQVVVSYAVVEFTGSNWSVQTGVHPFANSGVIETENPAISNTTKAFLITQQITNQNGLDEYGYQAWISNPSEVSFRLRNGAGVPNHQVRYWVVENSDSEFWVQRGSINMPNGSFTVNQAIPVAPVVAGTSNMGAILNNDCNGGGTQFPRACWIARLTGINNLQVVRSRNGQPGSGRYEVIHFPKGKVSQTEWQETY